MMTDRQNQSPSTQKERLKLKKYDDMGKRETQLCVFPSKARTIARQERKTNGSAEKIVHRGE